MSLESHGRELRIALIGCGEHSRENLVPSLALQQHAKVVAVCDSNIAFANLAGRHFPGCAITTRYQDIIAQNELDAVVVAATPQVHYAVARAGLLRGLHVFLEKPPTVTREQLVELSAIAEENSLVTCVGHNLRHATAAIELQSLLNSDEKLYEEKRVLNSVAAIEMRYFASKPRGDRWELNSPLRSFLLSHANHAIDFMIFQMGRIKHINAVLASENAGGITISVQFAFESGAIGNLLASSVAPFFSISGTIVSTHGRIAQMNSLHEVIGYGIGDDVKRWGRCWSSKALLTGYEAAGYSKELERFIFASLKNRPEDCDPSFKDEIDVYSAIDYIEAVLENRNNGDD